MRLRHACVSRRPLFQDSFVYWSTVGNSKSIFTMIFDYSPFVSECQRAFLSIFHTPFFTRRMTLHNLLSSLCFFFNFLMFFPIILFLFKSRHNWHSPYRSTVLVNHLCSSIYDFNYSHIAYGKLISDRFVHVLCVFCWGKSFHRSKRFARISCAHVQWELLISPNMEECVRILPKIKNMTCMSIWLDEIMVMPFIVLLILSDLFR